MNHKRTLEEWRAFRGLTRQKAAKAVGVHPTTWSKWEANPSCLKVSEAAKVAEVFGCETREIIFFKENPKYNLDVGGRKVHGM